MPQNSSRTISTDDCLLKAQHIIEQKKPFILISVEETANGLMSENLIHTAEIPGVRQKLDIGVLEFTKHIQPLVKLMWAMTKDNLKEGDKTDGNKE